MQRFLTKRILMMIPTLMMIILVVMVLLTIVPGDGLKVLSSHGTEPDWLDSVLEFFHMHNTFLGKYFRYIFNILHGHFGDTRKAGMAMTLDLPDRILHTMILAVSGSSAALLIGVPLGFLSAVYRGRFIDHGISTLTILLASIPSFCLAVAASVLFVIVLGILPLYGYETPKHFILPVLVTALPGIAVTTAMTRSAVQEVLEQKYVIALQALGLKKHRILGIHVLKNAFVGIMASFQNVFISILCSSLIAENFFSITGLGALIVRAVKDRNPTLSLACTVIFCIIVMIIDILCDMVCIGISPTMRKQILEGGDQK